MTTQGPNYITTGSDDSSRGSNTWSNPTNVQAGGSTYATVDFTSSAFAESHWLKGLNPGFSVPASSTINGVEVEVVCGNFSGTPTNPAFSDLGDQAKLVKGGAISGTGQSLPTGLNEGTAGTYTIGGPTNLWGLTLTAGDVNAPTFGFALILRWKRLSGTFTANIDSFRITVYYTPAVTRDLPSAASVSAPVSRDLASGAALSAPVSRNVTSAAALGTPVARDVTSAAALSIAYVYSDLTSAAAVSATYARDVTSAGAVTRTPSSDTTSAAAIGFEAVRSVTSAAALFVSGQRSHRMGGGSVSGTVLRAGVVSGGVGSA